MALTRLSPGVYQDESGRVVRSGGPTGMLSEPPDKKNKKAKKNKAEKNIKKLRQQQYQQMGQQDLEVGEFAGQQFGGVKDAYGEDFSFEGLPELPVADDAFRQRIEDENVQRYARQFEPRFQREMDDFEQRAYEKGWSLGTPAYEKSKKLLLEEQDRQRREYESQAVADAGVEMERYYNLGAQSHQMAKENYLIERDRPFQEWQAVRGTQTSSPMWNVYAQDDAQAAAAKEATKAFNRSRSLMGGSGGGGGGEGDGAGPYGFPSYQDYWAFQDEREKNKQMWEWANNPAYKQKGSSGPSAVAQVGGSLLGGLGQGLGQGLGGWAKGLFG